MCSISRGAHPACAQPQVPPSRSHSGFPKDTTKRCRGLFNKTLASSGHENDDRLKPLSSLILQTITKDGKGNAGQTQGHLRPNSYQSGCRYHGISRNASASFTVVPGLTLQFGSISARLMGRPGFYHLPPPKSRGGQHWASHVTSVSSDPLVCKCAYRLLGHSTSCCECRHACKGSLENAKTLKWKA